MEIKKYNTIKDPIPLEAMERLIQLMNDSPTIAKLANTEWKITALKPAVQWMISEEACKIEKVEKATFSDVLKGLSQQIPMVCRIITLALLNNKEKIENEYDKVYDTLFWECNIKDWAQLLFEVLSLIDVDRFFFIIESTQMFRQLTLDRKMMMEERKQLSREQNGVK